MIKEFFIETDRSYSVIADCGGHYVDFSVYDGDGHYVDLEPFLKGTVKWDGCSNWKFDDEWMHFCSKQEAKRLGTLLEKCYEMALELMPDNKEYLGDEKW
jgi:hypothetical protein